MSRRLEWAAGRDGKADAVAKFTEQFRGDHAFNTQPGHIPLRARVIRMEERAYGDRVMAAHHRGVASGIQEQLDHHIFSDDVDAVERLRARIAELEGERDRSKQINAEIRKGPGWEARLRDVGLVMTGKERADLLAVATHQPYLADKKTGLPIFPSYHMTNLGGNIRRLRQRLEHVNDLAAQRARVRETLAAERNAPITEEAP